MKGKVISLESMVALDLATRLNQSQFHKAPVKADSEAIA